MFLYFPEKLDQNEWTILVAVIINILIFAFLPKKISKDITSLIILLSMSFPKVMDHTMAVKPFDLYNLTDSGKYELFDVVLYGVYPAFGYLFVYFLDYFKGFKLVIYFIFWTMIAIGIEFLLVRLHVYVYTGWKLIYSLPIYIVVLSLTFLFYKFIIHYHYKIPHNKYPNSVK